MSLGFAGPSAEIGTTVATLLYSVFDQKENFEALVLAGSAAGLATNFNTPLSGIAFSSDVSCRSLKFTESKGSIL